MRTLDEMMARMGFTATDTGPHVTDLRKLVARQMSEGMTNRSAGTWAPGDHSAEDRAQAFLEMEWAIQQGHCYEVRNLDSGWSRPASMIGDWFRLMGFHFRKMRSRLLGRRNPYAR